MGILPVRCVRLPGACVSFATCRGPSPVPGRTCPCGSWRGTEHIHRVTLAVLLRNIPRYFSLRTGLIRPPTDSCLPHPDIATSIAAARAESPS